MKNSLLVYRKFSGTPNAQREGETEYKIYAGCHFVPAEEPADLSELVFCVHEMHLQIFALYVCIHIYIKQIPFICG